MAPKIIIPDTLAIRVQGLFVTLGGHEILNNLDLDVQKGEILGVVGASGTGKSVLLRAILGMVPRTARTLGVLGVDMLRADDAQKVAIGQRVGLLFQQGALFSALTVQQNVEFVLKETYALSAADVADLARMKIALAGLPMSACDKFPSQLSGGMIKRAALARAIALDPEILFLDEPTAGLDPIGAQEFDILVRDLQKTLGLTVFMVTHDLHSLFLACDRIAALGDKRVLVCDTMENVRAFDHPWIHSYFNGPRAASIHTDGFLESH